jgi:hypothetical protein
VRTAKTLIGVARDGLAPPKFSRSFVIPNYDSIGPNRIGRHWQMGQNVALLIKREEMLKNFISVRQKYLIKTSHKDSNGRQHKPCSGILKEAISGCLVNFEHLGKIAFRGGVRGNWIRFDKSWQSTGEPMVRKKSSRKQFDVVCTSFAMATCSQSRIYPT